MKLLFITAGNMVNRDLILLFELNWPKLVQLLEQATVVELDQEQITVHF